MTTREGTGFGHFPFGNFPFGSANAGEDNISRTMPPSYLEDSQTGAKNEAFIQYLRAIEDSLNRVKSDIDRLPDQVDFNKVDDNLLPFLGSTIDVTIDSSEPAEFQRTLVGNAVQFYRVKGTLESYQIRGKISGFDVTVSNLFKLAPDLIPFFPTEELFEVPLNSGDFYTTIAPGTVDAVSGDPRLEVTSCDYCLTSSVKLNFEVVKPLPPAITGEGNFFDRLAAKLQEITPIHVRDLLFEILAVTCVFQNENMEICNTSVDQIHTPVGAFHYFDMVPADCIPLDYKGSVSGLVCSETV